ncbi:hypothetical protein [Thermosipho atlanticus]|uniref:Uncharacterized protein n=1 Tax=Thermosipho atlanticus DSM 15807 TaxID=1123380 RepID=A0A1M5RRN3_9BACT|nr:hypothetical protein [Thermosipho atlanticus]SHH28935.1 hypothetical protein SAMN02745199_0581 [Thermosipho atlanticus DSM 15807]
MKRGLVNISMALILLLFSSFVALIISPLMKEAIEIEQRTFESIENTYSKILFLSTANMWKKFLTDNAAFWDDIQSSDGNATYTELNFNSYLKYRFSTEKNISYLVTSTTTSYIFVSKYISTIADIKRDGSELPYKTTFEFGWPGL